MKMTKLRQLRLCLTGVSLTLLLTACSYFGLGGSNGGTSSVSDSFASSSVCTDNAFLQRYHCSFSQISKSAHAGDPDAQYALGYLYYYGIGTVQDTQTAMLWINRAAAQGQSIAKRALRQMQGGAPAVYNGSKKARQPSVKALNSAVPDEPLSEHLPGYDSENGSSSSSRPAVLDSLNPQSVPPASTPSTTEASSAQ